MAELFLAVHGSKEISIFELLDQNGQYIEEVRSEYRRASQGNELHCPECNGILELCAGAIREPYFRHKSILDCQLLKTLRTEAGKRAYHSKKMLYSLVHTAEDGEVLTNKGKEYLPYKPLLFEIKGSTKAFIYLDGKSRNYRELFDA